ncbi:carbohydrate porin [Stenotrophomonas sp. SORGH_AS_0321]|uniref:carbohydrate porin n=1 Tax=Stenotrophomonas sp. SORGH_AS_0321 TaxID=3041787 RepID=UPI00285ADAA3|nr:carbohydrate porin [Stenotrophomonas sp. SORGH_AS_0321]MDR6093088.1 carbohydrate-selective porin OprB [Stenotrophomonas sp. SORGH_AS_0321]
MNHSLGGRRALAGLCLVGVAASAAAQGVTGDWGGRRPVWQDNGIVLDLGYTVEAARNTSGGQRRASAHAGQLSAGGRFDLEQLWGWRGTRGQLSLSLRDGDSLTARAGLGSLMASQEIHGRGHILRLGSLWLGRQSADGRFDAKAGRLAVGEDFNMLDCVAMNLALCGGQVALFGGDYWFNSPLSQWGAVVTWRPLPAVYLRAAGYQINPRYADERGGGPAPGTGRHGRHAHTARAGLGALL